MTSKSQKEWTEHSWNPISHCYAETMANRLKFMGTKGYRTKEGMTLLHLNLNDFLKGGIFFGEDFRLPAILRIFILNLLLEKWLYLLIGDCFASVCRGWYLFALLQSILNLSRLKKLIFLVKLLSCIRPVYF